MHSKYFFCLNCGFSILTDKEKKGVEVVHKGEMRLKLSLVHIYVDSLTVRHSIMTASH